MIRSPALDLYTNVHWQLEKGRNNWRKGEARQFTTSLDGDEIDHIQFILENLSKKTLVGLLRLKKELKKRGEKVEHVHPLSFFIAVLSPQCIRLFYDLRARKGMPYSEFMKGAIESFSDQSRRGNLTDQQLLTFANITKRNFSQIKAFASAHDWKGLIGWL